MLNEEIRALETEQGDLKALVDRAMRDKRAVEVSYTIFYRFMHRITCLLLIKSVYSTS